MGRRSSVYTEQVPVITAAAGGLAAFRRWAFSAEFPDDGRIDYLAGSVETDLSPEDLHTHGTVKAAIAAALHALIVERDLGQVFIDRARVSSPAADLSVEPDVLAVLWQSLESGRVRYLPRARGGAARSAEIEGGPDLVVEILSDSSMHKDTERLPRLYALAGVRELWLVDARDQQPHLAMLAMYTLESGAYREVAPDARGHLLSPLLGHTFRLLRQPARFSTWRYQLEHDAVPDTGGSNSPSPKPR